MGARAKLMGEFATSSGIDCKHVGTANDNGEMMIELEWSAKPASGTQTHVERITMTLTEVKTEYVPTTPALMEFLKNVDEPRRKSIEAARAAQRQARVATGKKLVCAYLGQPQQDGYVKSPLGWIVVPRRKDDVRVAFKWSWCAGGTISHEEIVMLYKHVATRGVK